MFLLARQLTSGKRVILFTLAICGWLEGLIIETLRLSFHSLGASGLLLGTLSLVFITLSLAFKLPAIRTRRRWIVYESLIWVATFSGLASYLSFTMFWASIEVVAATPLVLFWLEFISRPMANRHKSYLMAWAGLTIMALLLVLLASAFGQHSRLVFELALAFPASLTVALHAPRSKTLGLRPIWPYRTLGAVAGLFFNLGLGASLARRSALIYGTAFPWWLALSLNLALLPTLMTMPVIIRRSPHLMAYLATILLTIVLLGFFKPEPLASVWALEFLLLIAVNLLVLWWFISLVEPLRRSPVGLALAMGATVAAIAIGWLIPATLGSHYPWMLLAILMLMAVTPLTLEEKPNEAQTAAAHQKNLDQLFEGAKLTPQERRIVRLLLQGKSNQSITQELYVSINTLKTHLKNIYRKTETKNRRELIDLIGQGQQANALR